MSSVIPLFNSKNKNILSVLNRIKPGKALNIYENFYNDRKNLSKKYKGDTRSFIYVIVNKLNGKCYVGSSRSIRTRILNYFNLAHMLAQQNSPISTSRIGIASFSSLAAVQSQMRIPLNQDLLNPQFITGFTDAEGSFIIIIRKNNKFKIGWRVEARFSISLHKKDLALLQLIKNYFNGVGNINKERKDGVQYHITTLQDLTNVVIPHFNKFPLITQKLANFELFKMVIEIMNRKEHLTIEGLRKIVAIRASMNLGLSPELKASFPDIVHIQRPLVQDKKITDPYWLAGFTSGEGNFSIKILYSKTHKLGSAVQLRFKLTQHSKDEQLIKSLIEYFGAGNVYISGEVVDFIIQKFEDLTAKVIPFFEKYPINPPLTPQS